MTKLIIGLRNNSVGYYENPLMFVGTKEQASETYARGYVANKGTREHALMKECDLVLIGEWDDKTCKMTTLDMPEVLVHFASVLSEEQKDVKANS